MNNKTFLDKLEVGSPVIMCGKYNDYVLTVERITKTQIIVSSGKGKFNRMTGRSIGTDSWNSTYIHEATEKAVAKIYEVNKRIAQRNVLKKVDWDNVPIEKMKEIIDILNRE